MNLWRHPNRPTPPARIVPKHDVIVWHDTDTVSIEHLTRAEAMRLYELACTDVRLYGLTFVLGEMLGIDQELDA